MSEQQHNQVTIFSNGIADFRRVFQTTGTTQQLELPVNKDHVGDVLASLLIDGPVKLTVPPNFSPEDEQTGRLALSATNVFQDIFNKLRGSQIKVTSSGDSIEGRIWGLDSEEVAGGGEATHRYFGQILTSTGLRRVLQSEVKALEFPQESVRSAVDKALNRAFQTIRPQSTTINMEVTSERPGEGFTLHYAIPAAAWKMTYRLRVTDSGILLDGVGVVDNNTEEDWNDFLIGMVVGEPVTFSTDVATTRTPTRSHINLVSDRAQGGVEVERGYVGRSAAPAEEMLLHASLARDELSHSRADVGDADERGGDASEFALEAATDHREVGDFAVWENKDPLTIKAGQSAEIPVLNTTLGEAETVLFYKPENHSERPFRAIRFTNETGKHLGRGVCTVYEQGTYSGSAILAATKKGEDTLLCHALETGVRVQFTQGEEQKEIAAFLLNKGTALQTANWYRESEYTIKNVKDEAFTLLLDHRKLSDWECRLTCFLNDDAIQAKEQLRNGIRFEFTLPAHDELVLVVRETYTDKEQFVLTDKLLNRMIIHAEHPLADDPNIRAVADLQEAVETAGEAEVELQARLEMVQEEQSRIRDLISSDPNNDQWKEDLRDSEQEIRRISREQIPAAKARTRTARAEVQTALKDLACEWTKG